MKKLILVLVLFINWFCKPIYCLYTIDSNQTIAGDPCKADKDCKDITTSSCSTRNIKYRCEYKIGNVTIYQNKLVDKSSDCPKQSQVCQGVPRFKCTYTNPITKESASEIVNNCSACKETQATSCEQLTSTEYQCNVNDVGINIKQTDTKELVSPTEQSLAVPEYYQCNYDERFLTYKPPHVQNCSDCPKFKGSCMSAVVTSRGY